MNSKRLIEITLALVLWYFLAGLVFERVLRLAPTGYDREAFFLAGAALPWSALLLDFLEPPRSALGAVVQQALFLVFTAGAIALNAWLVDLVVVQALRLVRIRRALGRRRGEPADVREPRARNAPRADSRAGPGDPRVAGR